jgi:hypothetical protein
MAMLLEIANTLLLEQSDVLSVVRKAIGERLPISIYYSGPSGEVREGQRIDIEPVVLGKNAKSGNRVIWAYVFKGVSKRGLPGWKMFRLDRIKSAKFSEIGATNFKLEELPGYQKGKAPSAMKSLSDVEIFSPYWFEDDDRFKKTPPEAQVQPQEPKQPIVKAPVTPVAPTPAPKPQVSVTPKDAAGRVYNELQPKIQDLNGQRTISTKDYNDAINNLYHKKEDEFKVYQRQISGNERPGEGTRKRFTSTSKAEIDNLLSKDNIQVTDNPEQLAEGYRRQSRIKRLINW